MYLVRVKDSFCAAHHLVFGKGAAEAGHGHEWAVEAIVACPGLDATGIGVDFRAVKRVLHRLLDTELDHRNLNSIRGVSTPNPTSEIVARWIADRLGPRIAALRPGIRLAAVTVWETPDCGVTLDIEPAPAAARTSSRGNRVARGASRGR